MTPGATTKEPSGIIGLRAFARLVGVKLASIQDAIEAGRLTAVVQTSQGRKLRMPDALNEWDGTRTAGQNNRFGELPIDGEPVDPDEGTEHWGIRKTRAEALLAEERRRKLELEVQELQGLLHRAEDVEAVWAEVLTRCRSRLLALPAKLAPLIASQVDRQPAKFQALLESHIHEALAELAAYDTAQIQVQSKKRKARSR